MVQSIDIRQLSDAIFVEKDNGTKVHYFLYPEFEIHQNVLPANTVQDWHKHQAIEEIIVPTEGSVTIQVLEEEDIKDYTVHCGDVLRVKNPYIELSVINKQTWHLLFFDLCQLVRINPK